jgi:diadenosine tetraphosphate (Ap4A) HIT family hydrolase
MVSSYFDQYLLHQGSYWDTYVSERGRNNLGRIYFWLRREGPIKPHELTDDEKRELFELTERFWNALVACFQPDHYNLTFLANEKASHGRHCHFHMVPRYEASREFQGMVFEDPDVEKPSASKAMEPELAIAVGQELLRAA